MWPMSTRLEGNTRPIIEAARRAGDEGIARRDVVALGFTPSTAKRRLRDLVEAGHLERRGQRYYANH